VTFGAILGLILALGLVLGLFGLAVGVARRFATVGGDHGRLGMMVVDRTPLGPRQGLAAVRIGDRVIVVSVGDGGVHAVTELTESEASSLGTGNGKDRVGRPGFWRNPLGARAPLDGGLSDFSIGEQSTTAQSGGFHTLMRRGLRSLSGLSLALLFALSVSASGASRASAQGPRQGTAVTNAPSPVQAQASRPAGVTASGQQGAGPRVSLQLGSGDGSDFHVSGTVGTVLFMGLLTTLPTLLLLMTSFTRVLVVLHFARQALGTQGAPPGHLLAALALLLTGFIMAPTLNEANRVAIQPWMHGEIDEVQMLKAGAVPFRAFMLSQTSDNELAHFVEMSGQPLPDTPEQVSTPVLMTAFATGELRRAFQMGFAIFLPFVVIDLVVSAVLTSMGMFMLPPTMIALPIKLLLFVLVDGWSLLVGSLVTSFAS